jgi:HTH-type transcriptional repressor of NAD biosynthesis genes
MKYVTGLVVGKFCPLHKGHEYLIKSALEQCEKVIVISYTSESYTGCDAAEREKWIRAIECEQFRLEVYVLDGLVRIKDTAPDRAHREFCANYLLNTLDTTVQALLIYES